VRPDRAATGDGTGPTDDHPTGPDDGATVPDGQPDQPGPPPADGGDGGDVTPPPPDCFAWAGEAASGISLQGALDAHDCVEVQAGTFTLAAGVAVRPGKTLRGLGPDQSILVADQASWTFGCCDSMVATSGSSDPTPFTVSDLTLDGAGVATYNTCCSAFTARNTVQKNSRCSAIGIVGTGVTVSGNQLLNSAQFTDVPGRGTITCATGGFGGVAEGAAIYSQGTASDFGSLIENNTITGSYGPALDINGAWGGTVRNNTIADNSAWAAISLYGASNWVVEGNHITHPSTEPPQPYHTACATGPAGGHSAAIFLCQDTDQDNLVTNGNLISGNQASSFYGILSVGADEVQPYLAPRNNTFQNNDVFGSSFGCADDFAPGQWMTDGDTWTGNNCQGAADTGPTFF
jgi:parallel beta-helix repeat protein